MSWNDFLTSFPALLTPIVFWTVWKVTQIENKLMSEIKNDLTEVKTDIKWLVSVHDVKKRDEK